MKLYEVPPRSWVKYVYENQEYVLFFDHVDGMYSVCYDDKEIVHLPATLDVDVCTSPV